MENLNKIWKSQAQKVLSSILVDDGAIFPVMEIIKDNARWFPVQERAIWQGVMSCLDDMTPATVEAVTIRVNGKVASGYIRAIADQFNDDDNRLLLHHTEQLREIGILGALKEIGRQINDIKTIEDIESKVNSASTELTGLLANRNERISSAAAVSTAAWKEVEQFQGEAIPTGLSWFDNLTGGLWPGMNYWIPAAYKSGKSTLMRNCVLASAKAGYHTLVFCAEGAREMFALDCQAMIATDLLTKWGVPRKNLRLSGLLLMRAFVNDLAIFQQKEIQAVNQAKEVWNTLPINIYDTKDGIRDLTTLNYIIKRSRIEHGTKTAWLDYSQLFGQGSTLFDRQSNTALRIQEIASTEKIAMCVLAQKSEEGIKSPNAYSPNIKGGGDAAAAADFVIVPRIDQDSGSIIDIELKLSRHAGSKIESHAFNPTSGLIFDMM